MERKITIIGICTITNWDTGKKYIINNLLTLGKKINDTVLVYQDDVISLILNIL